MRLCRHAENQGCTTDIHQSFSALFSHEVLHTGNIDLQPYLATNSRFFLFTLMSTIFQEAVLINSTGNCGEGNKGSKAEENSGSTAASSGAKAYRYQGGRTNVVMRSSGGAAHQTQTGSSRLLASVLHHALYSSAENLLALAPTL
jgi:hypothetical protein